MYVDSSPGKSLGLCDTGFKFRNYFENKKSIRNEKFEIRIICNDQTPNTTQYQLGGYFFNKRNTFIFEWSTPLIWPVDSTNPQVNLCGMWYKYTNAKKFLFFPKNVSAGQLVWEVMERQWVAGLAFCKIFKVSFKIGKV